MLVEWNARMQKTAGFCYNRWKVTSPGTKVRSSRIAISTKVDRMLLWCENYLVKQQGRLLMHALWFTPRRSRAWRALDKVLYGGEVGICRELLVLFVSVVSAYPLACLRTIIYRVITKSLCTWWLQYKKHAEIQYFKQFQSPILN